MNIKEAVALIKTEVNMRVVDRKVREAIDTVVSYIERQELHKEMLSKVSTKEYGEDGIGLSKEDLDECLYK